MSTILALLGGAAGAAVIGLLGAWIQAGREHRRWLREKRYDAHLAFLQATDFERTGKDTRDQVRRIASEITLLGPPSVMDKMSAYLAVLTKATNKNSDEVVDAREDYVDKLREKLKLI